MLCHALFLALHTCINPKIFWQAIAYLSVHFPHHLPLAIFQKSGKYFPRDFSSSVCKTSQIGSASWCLPSRAALIQRKGNGRRTSSTKTEDQFSLRVPSAHTLWDTQLGWEMTSKAQLLSLLRGHVCWKNENTAEFVSPLYAWGVGSHPPCWGSSDCLGDTMSQALEKVAREWIHGRSLHFY